MAGNRQQFTLQFNADTTQAKKAIYDLNNALAKIQSENIISNGIDADLKRGAEAAKILQSSLQAAMNVDTGKLNLNIFNQSLKQSGQSLQTLSSNLLNAGSTGAQAFTSLARSIASAEVPLKKMNQTVANIMTTLKNTVKWELSSTAVHGLESALSGAVSYVKDLNGSLNDIRIVTGQSAEDMAKFAIQANKAAKELSTTTKAYADASLIYYQQGDTQEQAAKKAAITIKAANASFSTSAAEMSEYLTAVWNSYQVGADELERYVDIMAALGAKTATSLEEIATSMQKVAATGHTVGVSMEQVSSIIATVSSVTRESAESIGTSYKTIFARIGDLKLGGTTEDGIGLGQVSSQLDSIGVQILDTSGNLRDMGDIITDLGNKWQTMSEAQKVATAQVVAGKRQYTQLMALFENWDMYNQNLNIAETANGELDKQAEIHAESWEAAAARVKAAWEGLFSSLIDENVLISFSNGLEKIVSVIKGVTDSFGGMSGVLTALSSVALNVFQNQIAGAIDNVTAKISGQKNEVQGFADTYEKQLASLKGFQDDTRLSESQKVELQYTTKIMEMNSKLQKSSGSLTNAQISGIQGVIKQLEQERELYTGILRLQETINKESSKVQANKNEATKNAVRQYGLENNQNYDYLSATQQSALDAEADTNILLNILTQTGDEAIRLKEALSGLKVADDMNVSLSATLSKVQALTKASTEAGRALAAMGNQGLTSNPAEFQKQQAAREDGGVESAQANFLNTLNSLNPTGLTEFDAKVDELRQKLSQPLDEKGLLRAIKEFEDLAKNGAGWDEAVKKFKDVGVSLGFLDGDKFDKWVASLKKGGADVGQVGEQIKGSMKDADQAVEGFMQKTSSMSQRLVSFASGLTGLTTLFNGFKNGIETIFSGDTSGAEKLGAVISLITTATYGYVSATKLLTAVLGEKRMAELASQAAGLKGIAIAAAQTAAEAGQTGITLALAVAKKVLAGAIHAVSAAFKALMSSNPILLAFTAIVAVIGAAVGAVNAYNKAQEEMAKQNRETAKSRLEQIAAENKALQEESENVDKAYNAYEQMEEKRKESGEATDEYTTAVDSVLEALGREELKILATTGRYEELAEAIRKANEERLQQNGLIVQGNADASHAAADALFTNYDTEGMTYVSGTGKRDNKYYYIDGPGDEIRSQIDQAGIVDPRTGKTVSGYSILTEMGFTYDSKHDNLHIKNPTPENLERIFENMQMLFEIMPGLASLPGLKEVWEIMQATGGYIYDAENADILHGGTAQLTAMYGSNPDGINYNALYQSTGEFLQKRGYITDLNDPNASKLIGMVIEGYIASLGEDFNTELQTFTAADIKLQQLHLPPEFISAAQKELGNAFWEYLGAVVDPSVLDLSSPEAFVASLAVHGQQGQRTAELNRVMALPQRIEGEKTKVGTYDDADADRATVTAIFEDYYGGAEAAAPMLAAYFSATAEGQLAMLEIMGVGSAAIVQTAWEESTSAAQGSLDTLKTSVETAIKDFGTHEIFNGIIPQEARDAGVTNIADYVDVDNIPDWLNPAQSHLDRERARSLAFEAMVNHPLDVADIVEQYDPEGKYGITEEWLEDSTHDTIVQNGIRSMSGTGPVPMDYALHSKGLYTIDEINEAQVSLDTVTAQNGAYIAATEQATASMEDVGETGEQIVTESKAYENFNKMSGLMDKSSFTKADTWATLSDITGEDVETLQRIAASNSDAQWSNAMLTIAESQLGKIISASDFAALSPDEQQANTKQVVSDAEYAAAQAQLDEMRATNAETQFESSTRATENAIELAEKYADVLGNLSADSLKSLGANEWEQLGKAIGKTSEGAQAYFESLGSETKVIDELKNAQINQLQSAADGYGAMAAAAEEQRNKFAPNSEDYLFWEERRLQYIDQQTEALLAQDEVEREALNAKKELWEEAYAQQQASQEKDIENLKEQKAALDLLSKALETGALTDSERQTLSDAKIDVNSWDKLSTAEQRANWLAAEYSKVLIKIQSEIEAIAELDESKISTITEDDLATADSFAAALEEIEGMDEATKGAWMAAYEEAAKLGPVTIDSLKKAAGELPETYQKELEASKDGIMDIIREMYASMSEENRQSAEQAVNDWESAFKRIAALRKKILAGEDITGDIFGGTMDEIWQNFLDSGYTDYSQFSKDVKAGTYKPTQQTFDIDEWRTANGLDAFAVLDATGTQEITRENLMTHYGAQITQQEGESDADFATRQGIYAQEEINTDVKALLGAYQGVGETSYDIDDVIAAFNNGDETKQFYNAAGELVSASELINDAADTMADTGLQMSEDMEWYAQRQEALAGAQGKVTKVLENGDATATVNGVQGDQEELTKLDAALERAQAEGAKEDANWENLSAEDRDLLASYGVTSFDQVDSAASQCASALATLADVAYKAAETFITSKEGGSYTKNKNGEWGTTAEDGTFQVDKEMTAYMQSLEDKANSADYHVTDVSDRTANYEAQSHGFENNREWKEYSQYLYEADGGTGQLTEQTQDLQNQYEDLAATIQEVNEAWDDLSDSQSNNIATLKKGGKGTNDYKKALTGLTKTVKKVFGGAEQVTEDFVEAHLEDIEKMAKGDEEALERVEDALISKILGQDYSIQVNVDLNKDGIKDAVGDVIDGFNDIEVSIDGILTKLGDVKEGSLITPEIDPSGATQGLLDILNAGGETAAGVQAALEAIGWVPEVDYEEFPVTDVETVDGTVTYHYVDALGNKKTYTGGADGYNKSTNTIRVPKIGSNGQAQFKGLRKTGAGTSTTRTPPPGGGGGGGGGKPKTIDKKDPEDHKERYHETNQTLERLADELEKVDKLKSRAYGKGHLDAIKQEISLLKQEVGIQADYLRQAKEYLALDRNRVASLGGLFNEDGTISNYDELIDSIIAKYNAFVEKYNAADASAQEKMEEEKEEMDKWFEESMEWITQYEETLNITRDKENEILELQNEISAKALEGIQYKIEFEVELNEEEADFLDYLNEKYSEVLEKQDIMVENLVRQQQLAQENLTILNNAKAELDAKYASGELSQADYVSGLQDINNQILENLSTLEDLRKEIQEAYGNALEMATEAIDNHTEKMEHASSMMQSYISIMGLIGQGVDYQKLSEFYEKQYEYNLNSLKTQQDYLDVLKEEQAYYLAKMAAGELTETERKQFEDLQDTIAEVEEGILSKTEETLTALREAFALTVEGILKGFEESIAGAGNSLEDLAADYEYYLEVQERNVSASKELYEISKLNRQIEQDIADTSSSVYKQRLAALQEEIKAKSADRALTEYDIQMMNLEYELLQRQMALEEAKNAKDTVRLTRDSSGNMIYQYTANQDQIAEAQQGVEDVLQRMAEANAERVTQLEQETIDTYQNMVSQIEEIANSEVLTQEEKNAKIAEIVARTQEKMGWIQDQYIIATENTASTYERIQDQYGANMADAAQMTKDSMNGTIGEIIAKTNEFAATMSQVQTDVANELALLYQNMDTVLTTTKWDQAAESIENYDLVIEDAEQDAQKMINTLGGEDGLLDKIKDTTAAWDAQSVAINALIEYYEKLYQSILKIQQTESTKTPPLPSTPSTTPSTETKTEEKTPTTTEPEDEEANANQVQYQGGSWQFYTYDAASGGKRGAVFHGKNKSPVVTKEDESANRIKISGMDGDGHSFSGSWISKVYKNKELWKAYETGGLVDYTGPAWVDGTKNRPELMLSASDTENMLAAVQTVRSLDTATLTLLDDFIKLATSSMLSANSLHATGVHHTDQELQQQVHITAEFPNVQDSNEIQDAFDNLINRAAQFVGSIKK